ncbi:MULTISPECIES: zinc-dependent metalloprotease [unclassified Sphingomonas]|uniref:zinc-dependent metalloprotease n=1 Tax=unclassified Sphingomonas TaxID=196159 RepID=UPI00226A3634|nr:MULTISPECIES: zinc-dependent metalloprotease [unclassified Sphingomonas]
MARLHTVLRGGSTIVVALGLALTAAQPSWAAPAAPADGALLPVKVEPEAGRILLTLPAPAADGMSGRFLYSTAIKTGLGSAPIRIDHGMLGDTHLLAFRRMGRKVAVIYENPRYKGTGNADTERGVRDSFPFSTIAMLDAVSSTPDGGVTVDLAPFLTKDVMRLAEALNTEGKGFKLVDALSAADPASVKIFPDNIEMESMQTFASDTPGSEVDTIAPDGRQVSFTVHHSLVRLPAPGFVPRRFDIRSGTHATQVYDFGTPLGEDVVQQYANHFRLDKIDPGAARSAVKKPIVFYIDSAAPEPIRSALAEGVAWWNQAFEAAGFIDAFQVKILPPGADPQDVRYNIVNWDERQTRSWSYGDGVIDPRTGEIIKGNVVLEGLRLRQDINIFEGLLGSAQDNSGGPNDPIRISLARIRQLGAHEVGHAIGFVHNFAGSTQDRSSVMDYPFARIKLVDGKLDLGDAYAVGIGRWDKFTVDWLYGQPKPGVDPDADAARKADAAQAAGLRYMTDIDGRAPDLAVPGDNMWTDGDDKAPDLTRMMAARRVALAHFGPGVLHRGEPLADLRRKFAPIWLFHRYEVIAVGKNIGGIDYRYAVAGDGSPPPAPASAADQNAALDALLETLSARELTVPGPLALALSSGVNGRSDPQFDTEVFDTAGASAFDPLVAADVAAQVTLDTLLAPSRLTRVYLQHGRDPSLPGLGSLLDKLTAAAIDQRRDAVERRVAHRTILTMAKTRRDPTVSIDVAAVLDGRLQAIAARFAAVKGNGEDAEWCRGMATLLRDDSRLAREIAKGARPEPVIPPGMPIGGESGWFGD